MPNESIPKVVLSWTPPRRRKPGRPKTTWRKTVMAELRDMGLSWGEAQAIAKEETEEYFVVVAVYPTGDEDDK